MPTQKGIKKNLSQMLICNFLTQGLVKITDPKVTSKFIKLSQFVSSVHPYTQQLERPV